MNYQLYLFIFQLIYINAHINSYINTYKYVYVLIIYKELIIIP